MTTSTSMIVSKGKVSGGLIPSPTMAKNLSLKQPNSPELFSPCEISVPRRLTRRLSRINEIAGSKSLMGMNAKPTHDRSQQ